MIITRQKPIDDILRFLKDAKKVFIAGCAQCATVCKTGGEEEVLKMKKLLQEKAKTVTGTAVIDPPCHMVKVKQSFQQNKQAISSSDAILVMACGNGVQAVKDGTKGARAYPALDTLFLGKVEHGGLFLQNCLLCADCILDDTGAICPITICTKGLLNGPCGGSKYGKCEVDRERDCGWLLIYRRLKDINGLARMKETKPPKDNSKSIKPQKIILD